VLEREESQPDRCANSADDRDNPSRCETRVEKCRAPVEGRARAPQDDEHECENGRFLVVPALEERRDDPRRNDSHGRQPRAIQPPREALRQQQQRGARDASEEMRSLDHAERQHTIEKRETARGGRRRAGEQQDDPGDEREHREYARRELLGQPVECRPDARRLRPSLRKLVGNKDDKRDGKRQQVVDRSIHEQWRQQRLRRQVRVQQQNHQSFEHADTTRHVARQPE
jgi:hypothetical protein